MKNIPTGGAPIGNRSTHSIPEVKYAEEKLQEVKEDWVKSAEEKSETWEFDLFDKPQESKEVGENMWPCKEIGGIKCYHPDCEPQQEVKPSLNSLKDIPDVLNYAYKKFALQQEEGCPKDCRYKNEPHGHCLKCGKLTKPIMECKCGFRTQQEESFNNMMGNPLEKLDKLTIKQEESWGRLFSRALGLAINGPNGENAIEIAKIREQLLSSERKRIVEILTGKKKELGVSPLNTSGLSVLDTIARDMEFRKLGYISEWDANKNINDILNDIIKELNK
jgi:hypothetical protein